MRSYRFAVDDCPVPSKVSNRQAVFQGDVERPETFGSISIESHDRLDERMSWSAFARLKCFDSCVAQDLNCECDASVERRIVPNGLVPLAHDASMASRLKVRKSSPA